MFRIISAFRSAAGWYFRARNFWPIQAACWGLALAFPHAALPISLAQTGMTAALYQARYSVACQVAMA